MPIYRFRYDARGKQLIATQPPVAPVAAVPQPAQLPAPPAPQAPVVPVPEPEQAPSSLKPESAVKSAADVQTMPWDPVRIVIDLKEWLEDHPDFGLEMDLLEEREILRTPPHWSYVANDIESLRSRPIGDAGAEEKRRAADQYAVMLTERQAAVEKAVELAAFASVASDNREPDGRMHEALRALPKGGNVDPKIFNELPNSATRPPLILPDVKKWADALLERYEDIAKLMVEPDWAKVETFSWITWEGRLRAYRKRGRQRPFEVDRNDLLLRTRKAGPAAVFRNELAQMSLREWTEALLTASRPVPPPRSVIPIPNWVRGQIETELLAGRKTVVIVLGDSVTSPSSQWLPSKSTGCLWIAKERWTEFYSRFSNIIGKNAINWIFVVELSGDPKTLALAASQPPGLTMSIPTNPIGITTPAYMAKDKLPPEVTPVVPYVDSPKNVDDLVSRIESLKAGPQSAS